MDCPNCEKKKHTLSSAYKLMFKNYATFSGRSTRSEFWLANAAHALILLGFSLALFVMFFYYAVIIYSAEDIVDSVFFWVWYIQLFAYLIATFIPLLSLRVRRLHDTGKSALWILIEFVPMWGELFIFLFALIDSDPDTNRYGPNPKAQDIL